MSIVRVGATKQYSDNWENIFSGGRKSATKKSAPASSRKSAKISPTSAAKSAGKKKASAKRKSR